ncbi:hypothetical protein Scep_019681 [Stephania cephalantha]|uniref:Uncharacterized protein n=1 Tax=Stephania cephalantha TaxID=152367 RepID=A0AAP0NLL3_9MAGN
MGSNESVGDEKEDYLSFMHQFDLQIPEIQLQISIFSLISQQCSWLNLHVLINHLIYIKMRCIFNP